MSDLFCWLLACYAAGVADGRGDPPPAIDDDAMGVVDIVRADYQRRADGPAVVIRPAWLEALCEATPERIEETL